MKEFEYFISYYDESKRNLKENAISYLNDNALRLWLWFSFADKGCIRKINYESILEEYTDWTEDNITDALQELKRKKYLCLIDGDTGLWGFYDLPQIKGVWS